MEFGTGKKLKANWYGRNIMKKQEMRLERWAWAGIPSSRIEKEHIGGQA